MLSSAKVTPILTALSFAACGARETPGPEAPERAPTATMHDEHGLPRGHHAHGHHHGYDMDFSDSERFAAHFDDPARDAWQKPAEVIQLLALRPGSVAADLGAGTGYFEPYLSRAVSLSGRVLALDTEPNMVAHLTRRGEREQWTNVEARVVPSDDPKLERESVDCILVVNTWHHIGDRGTYAGKLRAALKPGGKVVIVDFTKEAKQGPPPEHRLAPEQVVRELSLGGLAARVAEESLPEQYVVIAER